MIWALITWPLPLHFNDTIPSTDRLHISMSQFMELNPGDHLQLYYHFWLARDMLAGKTPPFNNVYEFNMGNDSRQAHFSPYYVPFSLIFAATSPWLGDPAGWNLAGLASVLLGIFGCFALAQRYANSRWLSLAIALIVTAFPFRWITLLGGSPTGFGMGLLPWLIVGLDQAVRDHRPSGGFLAGLTLLGAYGTDLHCFYFASLLTPFWCAIAWGTEAKPLDITWPRIRATFIALLPTLICAALAAGLSVLSSRHLSGSDVAHGRSWNDVKLCSPILRGLLYWGPLGYSNHIYFGASLTALIVFGYALKGVSKLQARSRAATVPQQGKGAAHPDWLLIIVTLGILATILVSLGVNGPFSGLPLKLARSVLHKFTMIRQTTKIFCLMPTLLTILLALLFAERPAWSRVWKRCLMGIFVLLGSLIFVESALWFRIGLCSLPKDMPPYEAIATHADEQRLGQPYALAIPLWPGESHFSSVYEYGIIRSHVRLLNGYSPAVPKRYLKRVVEPLSCLNHGVLAEKQLAALKALSVRYIIFHEQPYPTRGSFFPSAIALRGLLQNPWLDPLAAEGPIRSFVIRDNPHDAADIPELWGPPRYWPSRQWAFNTQPGIADMQFDFPLTMRTPAPRAPNLRYLMRVSGGGTLLSSSGTTLAIPAAATWLETPLSSPHGDTWRVTSGQPRLEHALLFAGDGAGPLQEGRYRWPAADFFHQGATDVITGSIHIDPLRVLQGLVLYGPDLPFPAGRYRATLITEATTPNDADRAEGDLRAITIGQAGTVIGHAPVRAGIPVSCEFDYDGGLPLRLEYHYHRHIPIRVIALELEPLNPPAP
jgi:hypothetical protein